MVQAISKLVGYSSPPQDSSISGTVDICLIGQIQFLVLQFLTISVKLAGILELHYYRGPQESRHYCNHNLKLHAISVKCLLFQVKRHVPCWVSGLDFKSWCIQIYIQIVCAQCLVHPVWGLFHKAKVLMQQFPILLNVIKNRGKTFKIQQI